MEEKKVKEIAEKEFGETPGHYEEITGGLNSETIRLQVEGENFILQTTSSSEPHQLENCIKSFQFLQNSRVPVPKVVTDEVKEYNSEKYTIVEEMPGDSKKEIKDQHTTFISGKYLAYIHKAKNFEEPGWIDWEDGEPVVLGFPESSLKVRIRENMEENLETFDNSGADWLAEITIEFLDRYIDLVPEDFEPVFVHHDYNPGNILYRDGNITGILDMDYAHSSDLKRDIAKAAIKFWLRGGKREDFYRGYTQVRDIGNSFEEHKSVYLLETLIDELGSWLNHDYKEVEDLEQYKEEFNRLERKLAV